jgi:hypothetical protein
MIDAAMWLTVGVWLYLVHLELIGMVRRRAPREPAAEDCEVWGDPVGYESKKDTDHEQNDATPDEDHQRRYR